MADVREPGELQQEGKIPNAINIPLSSLQESLGLPEDVFHDKFNFNKPEKNRVWVLNSEIDGQGSNILL